MKKLALLLLCTLLLGSCSIFTPTTYSTFNSTPASDISKTDTYLTLKVFQTFDKGSALAMTERFDVVKIISSIDTYYDGKRLAGRFILVDTYTYMNNENQYKTVPVFVAKDEYNRLRK